ncbi:aromatic di-alanine and TPR containing protein [Ceratobasidium theobromae]|uniref:Aromatic di-alanine and TPR containing protein n=1 Tax=Ceratobasidium theobromae TaxID=1582974 RepID=A0A5N5QCK8_9AGAM|nr:aromatic di-alanine and TPR containing protein [Ceratobasidium theobromae]
MKEQLSALGQRINHGFEDPEMIVLDAATILSQLGENAMANTPDPHALASLVDAILSVSEGLYGRFQQNRETQYLDLAIWYLTEAIKMMPQESPRLAGPLVNLSTCHHQRFELLDQVEDINKAIESRSRAVSLAREGHPELCIWFGMLGTLYESRFKRFGNLEDINKAIEHKFQAIALMPNSFPERPMWCGDLGIAYAIRFKRLGKLEDINKAIEFQSQAAAGAPEGNIRMNMLANLGYSHALRFEHLGHLEDLDKAIECQTKSTSVMPNKNADMVVRLDNLGLTYVDRFKRLGDVEDIDKAIECHSRAVSLTPQGHSAMPGKLNNLGISYHTRFVRLGQLEDIEKAIEFQTRAISLAPNGLPNLAIWLNNLGNSHAVRFKNLDYLEDIDKAISYLSQAVSLTHKDQASLPGYLNNLGHVHQLRFNRLEKLEDIDKAIECQSRAASLVPEGHTSVAGGLNNLGTSYHSRFEHLGKLEDIDKAIEYQSQAVSLTPEDHPDIATRLDSLGSSHATRFVRFGKREDIDKAIECHSLPVAITPEDHPTISTWLNNLGNSYLTRFRSFHDPDDIDQAIEYHSRAISLTPKSHPNTPSFLNNLGQSYIERYELLHDPESLAQSMDYLRRSASSSFGSSRHRFNAAVQWSRVASLYSESETLLAIQTAMDLIPYLVWLGENLTQRYADVRRIGNIASVAAATAISAGKLELALEWLEQSRSVVWNQTLQLRTPFEDLASANQVLANKLRQVANELNNAASRSRGETDQTENELDLEQTAQKHRRLAEKYDKLVNEVRALDGFENFLHHKKAHELLSSSREGPIVLINVDQLRCDALILLPHQGEIGHVHLPRLTPVKAIQARAQLQHSLQGLRERGVQIAPETDELDEGVVAALATMWTGAANPATQVQDQQNNAPRDQEERGIRVAQRPGQEGGFHSALSMLWTDIVKPVLDHLQYTQNIDSNAIDLPHVTWCATGPLAFLPLHAAGNFNDSEPKVFDYVISSYTPTLSALLSGRLAPPKDHSRLLAVGQENTPGHNPLPATKPELDHIQRHAPPSIRYTQLSDHNATVDAVSAAIKEHDWVHFACHAYQDRMDPTESGFFLHDGTLSFARILQKSFQNKGLAFLSACQTATGDDDLPDEAIHLASSMLMVGYPSVIATMWSVQDDDAPVIADKVYAQLLKDGKMDYREAAKALHLAVKELRVQVGEKAFGRWVPYIHIGV